MTRVQSDGMEQTALYCWQHQWTVPAVELAAVSKADDRRAVNRLCIPPFLVRVLRRQTRHDTIFHRHSVHVVFSAEKEGYSN